MTNVYRYLLTFSCSQLIILLVNLYGKLLLLSHIMCIYMLIYIIYGLGILYSVPVEASFQPNSY